MSKFNLTIWSLFLASALGLGILLLAFLGALLVSQRRRLAQERAHARRILTAQEDERSRVARELHDDALQRVAVIRHELDEIARLTSSDATRRIAGVGREIEDLAVVLRTAAHHLHPSVVEKAGLLRALRDLAGELGRTMGLDVGLSLPAADLTVAPSLGVAAYRIAQEALRNVAKHAGVRHAELALAARDDAIELTITDAGRGFESGDAARTAGLGFIAMRQRAEAVGGKLAITAAPGGGTRVSASFPLTEVPNGDEAPPRDCGRPSDGGPRS